MRKVSAILFSLLASASLSLAFDCVCGSGDTCTTGSATNWTACNSTFPQTGDSIRINGAATVNLNQASEQYLWIYVNNGTMNCNAAVDTLLLTATDSSSGKNAWIAVNEDNSSTFTCTDKGRTIQFNPSGAIPSGGAFFLIGNGSVLLSLTTDANATLRGEEKVASGIVANFTQGATATDADFVDCFDIDDAPETDGIQTPTGLAVDDNVVFTSGKSKAFWYRVTCSPDACTGAGAPDACCSAANATTECGATACGGGPCDIQLTRDDTSNAFNSMTMAVGSGGPVRHATPVDPDADGTAESNGTRPADGDALTVFDPLLITGTDPPTTDGFRFFTGGVNLDMRYVELAEMLTKPDDATCAASSGEHATHFEIVNASGPEGTIGFVNLHDYHSPNATEFNRTDITDDSRANRPTVYEYWYIHDPNSTVEACAHDGFGGGANVTSDNSSDTDFIGGYEFQNFHIARLYGGNAAFGFGAYQVNANNRIWQDVRIEDALIHSFPKNTTYPSSAASPIVGLRFRMGASFLFDGISMWDIGNASTDSQVAIVMQGEADASENISPDSRNTATIRNAFVVNIDSNADGDRPGESVILLGDTAELDDTTDGLLVSNSYIANLVGAVGAGGRWINNFIKDAVLDDDGAAPCLSGRRGVLHWPTVAQGNVITRDSAAACANAGLLFDTTNANNVSPFTKLPVWSITSNLVENLLNAASTSGQALIWFRDTNNATGLDTNVNVYHNVLDYRGADNGTVDVIVYYDIDDATADLNVSTYYNILIDSPQHGIREPSASPPAGYSHTHDYNRFAQITNAAPVTDGSLSGNETDSDSLDIFIDRANNHYRVACDNALLTANPSGKPIGPLRYGIQGFSRFHPAVLDLLDSEAFEMVYDWRECQVTFQDKIFR